MNQILTRMKALSVMNPWAAWIADGKKTIERRTWDTQYRVALCVVDLVDVRELTEDDTHNSLCAYEAGCFAWVLKNLRPVAPIAVKGRLGLFDVEVPEGWAL